MEYQVQFGSLNAKALSAKPGKSFRIGVLGDFSARGNLGRVEIGDALATRKPLRVTHENVDELLARLDVHLQLPAGASGAMIDVPIRSLDDFHPDQLYSNVPLFEKLVSLRQKLQDPTTFPKAASAVQSLVGGEQQIPAPVVTRSSSSRIPRGRIESFADLIKQDVPPQQAGELKTLLRDVVGKHIVPEMKGQAELLAALDQSLSDLMRRVLHHPDFQALESLWRSLDLLLHRLEIDSELELVLYDINAAEMAADLSATDSLENTGLYRWLVEAPSMDANQGPLSILICNFMFEQIPPHAELLARIAKIAGTATAPFIAAIDCAVMQKQDPDTIHPLVKQSWDSLRGLPEANYLALVTPRFMLRWPYGKKTEPIESFALEEFTAKSGLSGMLWGNSAFLAGLVIAQTYANDGLGGMKLGSLLTVDDIPFYYYNDADGDQIALPCTERLVNVRASQTISQQGFVPALSIQGRPEVRLGGLHSLTGKPLAGPWAPLKIDGSQAAPMTSTTTTATPAESAVATPAPASAASVDDELDSLLSGLDDAPASSSPPPPDAENSAEEAAADELDNLLASMDSADSAKAADEGDVDADLASLLADL